MKAALMRILTGVLAISLVVPAPAFAQDQAIPPPPPGPAPAPPPPGSAPAATADAPAFLPQQLDQMLAPIALYPDPLLGQVLMASTYPLEVVEAARWLQNPANAGLRGTDLAAALEPQPWDPSVKALVEFPQVLRMMDSRLDWMQQLGDAFLAQQADVMDAVQRLRQRAQAAGTLAGIPHESVVPQGPDIAIEPAQPQLVYVPIYDPNTVYGAWPDPDYPPLYFPPPPNYVAVSGIAFGIGVAVIGGLWGWDHWDWRAHRLRIDPDRFERLERDHDRAPQHDRRDVWEHDPAHRRGVPYHNPASQARFQDAAAAARRDFRGFESAGRAGTTQAPSAEAAHGARTPVPQSPQHATIAQPPTRAPQQPHLPPAPSPQPQSPAQVRPAAPAPPRGVVQRSVPAFDPAARGAEIRAQAARGQASRQTMTAPAAAPHPAAPTPHPPAPHAPAPSGGEERHH